ncbi:UNVERIFIED_CONTAM: Pathogenesis-related thaumatin-like protein 3.5 [Sesamum radiatum]|uniref:Pathogenesis-related thaumatin-like protein 3.5 n=1 Tax=Sesamum radiatum TaxID=300843 RepID=A0AAW2MXC5_SESRA
MAFNNFRTFFLAFLVIASGIGLSEGVKFTIINYCKETIWPGITPNNFSGGGFALKPAQSAVFTAPPAWNGRIWARTGCNFDRNAEFTLGDIDYYDVSLVDGFNLPIVVKPVSGKGNCSSAGCDADLRPNCPPELTLKADGKTVACQSACSVFNTDEYCCRGAFSTPMACLPTNYSRSFKAACPAAYSFAHDDPTSIITCSSTDYIVNQTQCTFHDNQLTCNRAMGTAEGMFRLWKLLLMAFAAAVGIPAML